MTLAPTTSEPERIFSLMKLIKTRLRSTMTEEKLSNLILVSKSKDSLQEIVFEEFIDEFCSLADRRLKLK